MRIARIAAVAVALMAEAPAHAQFNTGCDYTSIGPTLFAAGESAFAAYREHDPIVKCSLMTDAYEGQQRVAQFYESCGDRVSAIRARSLARQYQGDRTEFCAGGRPAEGAAGASEAPAESPGEAEPDEPQSFQSTPWR